MSEIKTITVSREAVSIEIDPDNLVKSGTHVMGCFRANDEVFHLQVENDERRDLLESQELANGEYWACLTGKNIANFLATRTGGLRAIRPETITLKFRKQGGSFLSAE